MKNHHHLILSTTSEEELRGPRALKVSAFCAFAFARLAVLSIRLRDATERAHLLKPQTARTVGVPFSRPSFFPPSSFSSSSLLGCLRFALL